MEIDKTNRNSLKGYFQRGKIPTQQNFAELIDASLNQAEDGLVKKSNEALSVQAYQEADKELKVFKFYKNFADENPTFQLALNGREEQDFRQGLSISNASKSLLFIDEATGRVGLGTNAPAAALDVSGGIRLQKDAELLFADNGQIRSADNKHRILFQRQVDVMELREAGKIIFSPGATDGKATNKIIIEPDGDLRLNRRKLSFFTEASDDINHSIYNNYNNLDDEGKWDGIKVNAFAGFQVRTGDVKTKQHKNMLTVTGKGLGVGTTSPDDLMHVAGNMVLGTDAKNKRFLFHPRAGKGDFLQITPDNEKGAWNWSGGLSINRAGNVGVRTNEPAASLDVNGTLAVRGNADIAGKLTVGSRVCAGNSDLYFTKTNHTYTGYGNSNGFAAIENASNYSALMILGRKTDKGRIVKLWDYLQINGKLETTDSITAKNYIYHHKPVYFSAYVASNELKGKRDTLELKATSQIAGNCFSRSKSRFTAPVKGIYMFCMSAYKVDKGELWWFLMKNGDYANKGGSTNSENTERCCLRLQQNKSSSRTLFVHLNANDYISIKQTGNGRVDNYSSGLEGCLIQALP